MKEVIIIYFLIGLCVAIWVRSYMGKLRLKEWLLFIACWIFLAIAFGWMAICDLLETEL